jgi:hypothetical protein
VLLHAEADLEHLVLAAVHERDDRKQGLIPTVWRS